MKLQFVSKPEVIQVYAQKEKKKKKKNTERSQFKQEEFFGKI